jgi:cytoskeletal protein CcmA (bactofilin family)
MWKKQEEDAVPGPESPPRSERRPSQRPHEGRATIGRSITIRGEVIGEEDLLIEGRVEGSVNLKQHSVTVGPEGEVTADVQGRVVIVEGHVEGDLHGDEQVILRETADVLGDIKAPRVTLEDGGYFRGSIEMTKEREAGRPGATGPGGSGTGSGGSGTGSGSASGSSGSTSGSSGSTTGSGSGTGSTGSGPGTGKTGAAEGERGGETGGEKGPSGAQG